MTTNKSDPLLTTRALSEPDPQDVEARGELLGKAEPLLTREEMDERAKKWVDAFVERRAGSICG